MTQAAARHGYAGASIARVVDRAGVSRATFYEHFRDRADCFLAAYREVVGRLAERLRIAIERSEAANRPQAILEVLLAEFAADPAAAKLVLIEALAAEPAIRSHHEHTVNLAEDATERFFADQDGAPEMPAAAVLGGVLGTVARHLLDANEVEALSGLQEPLMDWLSAYRGEPGSPRVDPRRWRELGGGLQPPFQADPEGAARLPRGRAALSRVEADRQRRERILAATAATCAQKGYAALTVADIVAAARVTRGVFYASFGSKEAAFGAAQSLVLQGSVGVVASAFFAVEGWPHRVWAASEALLAYFARNPTLAHLWVVEANAAGARALARQSDARAAFATLLEEGYCEAPTPPPRFYSEAIGWAVLALIRRQVLNGRAADLLEILPQVVYVIVAPFIGRSGALQLVEERSRSAPRGSAAAP